MVTHYTKIKNDDVITTHSKLGKRERFINVANLTALALDTKCRRAIIK
jgi:hypothetical protein